MAYTLYVQYKKIDFPLHRSSAFTALIQADPALNLAPAFLDRADPVRSALLLPLLTLITRTFLFCHPVVIAPYPVALSLLAYSSFVLKCTATAGLNITTRRTAYRAEVAALAAVLGQQSIHK